MNEVDPYLVALLFRGRPRRGGSQIRAWIAAGKAVILDRYVYSNVGFQCAKLPAGEPRDRLAQWILDLEFGYNGLPRPDMSLFLDVPFAFTERKLSEAREGDDRTYLQGGQDIHEGALDLQRRVREVYLAAAAKGRFRCAWSIAAMRTGRWRAPGGFSIRYGPCWPRYSTHDEGGPGLSRFWRTSAG